MNSKSSVQGYDISSSSAAIIGCGGLGTNIAVHLAGAGIGRLILCDYDTVQPSNLNRQFFYTSGDIGERKALILAERLRRYAPDTEITAIHKMISCEADLTFASDVKLLIIAVDNADARKVIASYCKKECKPYINGGVDGQFGTAYLCVPGGSPGLDEAGGLKESETKPLASSPTVGVIGALEAKLAVDHFLGKSFGGVLYVFDKNEITALDINQK